MAPMMVANGDFSDLSNDPHVYFAYEEATQIVSTIYRVAMALLLSLKTYLAVAIAILTI